MFQWHSICCNDSSTCSNCVLCMVKVLYLSAKMRDKVTVNVCRFNVVRGAGNAEFCVGIMDLVDPG